MDVLPISHAYGAALFDMDGTLLNSIAAAERVWSRWAARHGIDIATFLPTIHGVRAVETIRNQNLPGIDPEAEAEALTRDEIADVDGIVPIDGAAAFIAQIPAKRVAIVTSAPRALAVRRLAAARLGVAPAQCVVFEDAAAGIAAGEAAGCAVIVVTATHHDAIDTPHPTIASYRELRATAAGDGFTIERRG